MLHHALLPGHARWSAFLRSLRYVVVDESHHYRGVFGSNVALVLRRLRRLAARYRAEPTFVLASATTGDPGGTARALTGLDVEVVLEDASPRGGTHVALWEPPLTPGGGENGAPTRRTAVAEATELLADLVVTGTRSLAFVPSRRGAEAVAAGARRLLEEVDPELRDRVAAYRGGYLPEERRALEADLREGRLLGLATTNALELGIDVAGLDAVLVCGWPGRRASLWQQAGRAGRRGGEALAVLVARDDPLDTFLVHHPEAVFGADVEATVLDPGNPYVLAPHLCAAAAELPVTEQELDLFGPDARALLDALVARGALRRELAGGPAWHRWRPRPHRRGGDGPGHRDGRPRRQPPQRTPRRRLRPPGGRVAGDLPGPAWPRGARRARAR
jgi:DEAD/DEAH box helicase domain-containing protein